MPPLFKADSATLSLLLTLILRAAISARNPPRGCVHHSDRGSQYASEDYRVVLQKPGP
jgi:hypothetical protein